MSRRAGGVALLSAGVDRLVVLAVPLVLPWTLVATPASVSLVFPWGLVSAWPLPLHAVSLSRYLTSLTNGLPGYLWAWPSSVVLYACALATTSRYRPAWVDDDATAALLAFAGLAHLLVSVGLWRGRQVALPVGTLVLWTLAYAVYQDDAGGGGPDEGDAGGGGPDAVAGDARR
jgi:uncharacterized protein (TIGR04206 family)